MSGGIPGVNVRGDLIVNQQEANQHLRADGTPAPEGTKAVEVGKGQSISEIMHDHGLDWNNPKERAQFLKDNPQFTDQPATENKRSADLVYPGERIYLREPQSEAAKATDQAARELAKTEKMPAGTDSQITAKENAVARDKTKLEQAIRAELAAGGNAEDIKKRLTDDPSLTADEKKELNQIVDAATKPASPTNPIGGEAAKAAPLSPAHATNEAARAVQPSPVNRNDPKVKAADDAFVAAVKKELEQGVSVEELKERYGNDPWLNGFIDQAAKK